MAKVYTIRVKVVGFEEIFWRDIEISSAATVARMGFAILAAFETTGSYLFNFRFKRDIYEISMDEHIKFKKSVDARKCKLIQMGLKIGDVLYMEYNFAIGWKFSVELIAEREMTRNSGKHFPYIVDGDGKGIIENKTPEELKKIISKTNLKGYLPKVRNHLFKEPRIWDYRYFDLKEINKFYKEWYDEIKFGFRDLM